MRFLKRILPIIIIIIMASFASANISDYTFTNTTGSFSYLSGSTQIFGKDVDDDNSSVYTIGFTFLLDGVSYTEFSVNVNGIVKLGGSALTGTNFTNDLTSSAHTPLLAPFWDDLLTSGGNPSSRGNVSYKLTGSSGSYVLTVEFYRMKSYNGSNRAISFQVKLYEGSNKIEYIYKQESAALYYPSASIGIAGFTSGDFIALYNATDTATSNSATDPADIDTKPSTNRVFRFEPPNMDYFSSTTTQLITTDVQKGSINNQIIGIEIVVTGSSNPIDVTSFSFNTSGCTNPTGDIQNAKLWSTGTNNSFATTNKLGSTVSSPNGSFTINGFTNTLTEGTNYYWLSYDIKSGATNANNIDAECSSITVDGTPRTPTITAPSGYRQVESIMIYSSSNVVQITEPVGRNTVENPIIRIEVVTTGSTNPLNATSFSCNTAGTNNPTTNIKNAELYATGTSSTFSNGNQFGSTISTPNGSMSFNSSYTLSQGTNYFWLTYDIKSVANIGEVVDGVCSQITISASNKTPSVTTPSGNREIVGVFWIGGSGSSSTNKSDWNRSGNWSNGTVPTSTTDVLIPAACTYEPIIYDNITADCRKLTINSGATVTVEPNSGGRFSIYGDIINNGIINQTGWRNIHLRGSSKLIGGIGDFSNTEMLVYSGANYTLSSDLTLNYFDIDAGSTFNLSSFDLTISNDFYFRSSAVINGNTGNLIITDVSPTILGTLNAGSSTTYFNGTNYQTIPTSVTYNSLKVKVNNGTKNIGSSSISCTNIELINPGSGNGVGKLNGGLNITGNVIIGSNCTFDISSSNCNIDSNWINNGNITSGTGTVTFDGNGNQSIGGSTGETFYNLTIDKNSGTVNLSDNITVNNTLTLTDGNISLGDYDLILDNSATISGGSDDSYIEADGTGVVRKNINSTMSSDYFFPVGDNNDYSPFSFRLVSGSLSSAYVSLSVTDAQHSHMKDVSYITRYWTLSPTGISGNISYNVSYVYTDNDVVGNEAELLASKYSNGSTIIGGSVNVNTNTLSMTALSSFSDFGGVNDDEGIPLPIELVSFEAKLINDIVELKWVTTSETNNDFFTIEKTLNAEDFETVSIVKGAGNSNEQNNYFTSDLTPYEATSYYRLKQTDYDGNYSYSELITITNIKSDINIQIFPNPVLLNESFNIIIDNYPGNKSLQISIFDSHGKSIYNFEGKTNQSGQIELSNLSCNFKQGLYLLIVRNDKSLISKKILVQ